MSNFEQNSPMSIFVNHYREKKRIASKPYPWKLSVPFDIFAEERCATDPYQKYEMAARAMADLEKVTSMNGDVTPANYLLRHAIRGLYSSGRLNTSKTAATLIDTALRKLEGTDKFEYEMSRYMLRMMQSELEQAKSAAPIKNEEGL